MARLASLLTIAVVFPLIALSLGNAQERSPTLDQSRQDNSATIVVPVGTKIVVDISEENPARNVSRLHTGKVIDIVQVGSIVAIPALSKVSIQHLAGTLELTEVTVNGVQYKLLTDRLTIQEGSLEEATFTLKKAFTIKR